MTTEQPGDGQIFTTRVKYLQNEVARLIADRKPRDKETREERQFYEARMKFLHDEEARLIAAYEEGRAVGLEEGRRERLVGQIQLLEKVLGEKPTDMKELLQRSRPDLEALVAKLRQRTGKRQ